jgi:hypothetical protein
MSRRFGSSWTTPPPIASPSGRWSGPDDATRPLAAYRKRLAVAARTGDRQTKNEIEVSPIVWIRPAVS